MLKLSSIVLLGLLVIQTPAAHAKNDLGQGRLFYGLTTTSPTEVKTELLAQGLKDMNSISQAGVEITFPAFEYLSWGLRYTRHFTTQDESTSDPLTDYSAQIAQDSMLGIIRVPFYKSDYILADVFAGVGASNTTYKEKVVAQDGELTKSASAIYAAGASVAFGFKQYFFFVEGGIETNKVESFERSGTINSNINSIDLSGSYIMAGFLFDGIPIFKK
jgi:hypothetical protein